MINIELQGYKSGADPKRLRYYASAITGSMNIEDDKWHTLADTKVIFICKEDYIGEGESVYHIERIIRETGKALKDGEELMYINGEREDDEKYGKLMHDLNCTRAEEMYYEPFARRVAYIKQTEKGRKEMCEILENMIELERKEAKEEGEIIGQKRGITIGEEHSKIGIAIQMIRLGKLTFEEIAIYTGLSIERVKSLAVS